MTRVEQSSLSINPPLYSSFLYIMTFVHKLIRKSSEDEVNGGRSSVDTSTALQHGDRALKVLGNRRVVVTEEDVMPAISSVLISC